MIELAANLSAQGEKVVVLGGGLGVFEEILKKRKVTYKRIKRLVHPIAPFADLGALLEIRRHLKSLRPDLVTTHSNKAGFLGRLAAYSLGIPVIHTSHGWLFDGKLYYLQDIMYLALEKIAARIAVKVITVSDYEKEIANKLALMPSNKMVVIHNGLPDLENKLLASPGAGIPRLISVARFAEPKDHLTLLQALSKLNHVKWQLDLVGDGAKKRKTEKLAEELLLEEKINFLGNRNDVPELLAKSSLFILSSKREGFPISILEAMRAGLPVIATDVGGVSEAVIDGETGYLVPVGDYELMQKKICKLIEDPTLGKRMGAKGRERFLQHFTLDKMVDNTLELYREVVGYDG